MNNYRKYGFKPFKVAVIHGGPGAPGEIAPIAKELSSGFGVIEPLQTANTIDGQLDELLEILSIQGNLPITLAGHSWGAWLVFIFAAKHPEIVKKIILVSSAPF